jgi:hypothetical protein
MLDRFGVFFNGLTFSFQLKHIVQRGLQSPESNVSATHYIRASPAR